MPVTFALTAASTAGGVAPSSVEVSVYDGVSCGNGTPLKPYVPQAVTAAGTYNVTWTPTAAGPFTAYGRVWNDGIAECRSACVDGPPRFLCAHASVCKLSGTVTYGDAPPAPVCLSITTNGTPAAGQTVTFTCGQVAGASRYEFRIALPDGSTQGIATASGNTSAGFVIPSTPGTYKAQCRICTGTDASTCQAYQPL